MGLDVFDAIAVKSSVIVGSGSQNKPSLAFGNGDSGIYKDSANVIGITLSGGIKWYISSSSIQANNGLGAGINNITSSATIPTLIPNRADGNTGIGRASTDNLSLIAGGLEGARIEDPADCSATETSLFLYDKDNDTVEKVTVGAANSGGAGFKVLRIPN